MGTEEFCSFDLFDPAVTVAAAKTQEKDERGENTY